MLCSLLALAAIIGSAFIPYHSTDGPEVASDPAFVAEFQRSLSLACAVTVVPVVALVCETASLGMPFCGFTLQAYDIATLHTEAWLRSQFL